MCSHLLREVPLHSRGKIMLAILCLMMCYHCYDLIWMKLIFHLGKQKDVGSLIRSANVFKVNEATLQLLCNTEQRTKVRLSAQQRTSSSTFTLRCWALSPFLYLK